MKEKGYVLGIEIRHDRLTRFESLFFEFVNPAIGRKLCLVVHNNF